MNSNIIRRIPDGTICWYPSAGDDLNAMDLWLQGLGSELKPSTFIFSDLGYTLFKKKVHYGSHDFHDYFIDKGFEVNSFEPINFNELPKDKQEFLINEINLDVFNIKEISCKTSWSLNETMDIIELVRVGIIQKEVLLKAIDFNIEVYKSIEVINKERNIRLVFISGKNMDVYSELLRQNKEVSGMMIQRCCDEALKSNYKEIIRRLKVKEGFFCRHDKLNQPDSIYKQEFQWIYNKSYKEISDYIRFRN